MSFFSTSFAKQPTSPFFFCSCEWILSLFSWVRETKPNCFPFLTPLSSLSPPLPQAVSFFLHTVMLSVFACISHVFTQWIEFGGKMSMYVWRHVSNAGSGWFIGYMLIWLLLICDSVLLYNCVTHWAVFSGEMAVMTSFGGGSHCTVLDSQKKKRIFRSLVL